MVERYRRGESLGDIGQSYSLSRERIRQLIRPVVAASEGGRAIRSRKPPPEPKPPRWPPRTHGEFRMYSAGCRCDECRGANRERMRVQLARLRAKFQTGLLHPPHGSRSTYLNYGCRCRTCTTANSETCKASRRRRLDRRAERVAGL